MEIGHTRTSAPTVVIIGPPGVGKSTVSRALHELAQFRAFAVRLHYEAQLRARTALALRIRDALTAGARMIPDALVVDLFTDFIAGMPNTDPLLLEGFPINRAQARGAARVLASCGRRLDCLVHLDGDEWVLRQRVLARVVCSACERRDGSGAPVEIGAKACQRCGSADLAPRADDGSAHFDHRYARYRAEERAILAALPQVARISVNTDDRKIDQLVGVVTAAVRRHVETC